MTRSAHSFAAGPRGRVAMLGAAALLLLASRSEAQLDQLGFVKRMPPNVVIVLDASWSMLTDGSGTYYDPFTYTTATDPTVSLALGVAGSTSYRRMLRDLRFENTQSSSSRYYATDIVAVPNSAASYAGFFEGTRLEVAKRGIAQAAGENAGPTFRWGLVKLRQNAPQWRASSDCDKPVRVTGNAALAAVSDSTPCSAGATGRFGVFAPRVTGANSAVSTADNTIPLAAGVGTTLVTKMTYPVGSSLGIIPAGAAAAGYEDRPLTLALQDARAQIVTAMTADGATKAQHRNSIVVVVTGGPNDGAPSYVAGSDPVSYVNASLASVTASGVTRKVTVFVVGVKTTNDTELKAIASAGGGAYFSAASPAEVARAINLAVQSGFRRDTDVESSTESEFSFISPVVGTVNLANAKDHAGAVLPNTEIQTPAGVDIPQRSNVLVTAGFSLGGSLDSAALNPGFQGRLRAFRVYRPVADSTRPTGWKFVADGTRLWPNVDGRPATEGLARLPVDPNQRNIFTYVPGSGMVAFTTANAALLSTYLGASDAATLITLVRSQPLGSMIGSTPAIMDRPSLEPAPDTAYGQVGTPGTYADDHRNRRSIIWVGANDGMMHAIDARTGFEVWAFIPFNLLPKLRTLADGQPVEQYEYFVDSSPKIADVKLGGTWKTLLLFGEGPGGTFYQAFDVSNAGEDGPAPDSDDYGGVLATFASATRVQFLWAFPRYSSFDPAITATLTVADGTPGGKVKMYGDIKSTASSAEKSVGFTWSDPAVGPLDTTRTTNGVFVGSGYFPDVENLLSGRGVSSPRAGRSFYVLNLADGLPLGNPGGACSTSASGTGCLDLGDANNNRKNALQADVTAASDNASPVVVKAYAGDVDGNYWRFSLSPSGAITRSALVSYSNGSSGNSKPIYASSALMTLGTSDQYIFFATGSDQLPVTPSATGGTGTFQLWGIKDNYPASGATVKFKRDLAAVSADSSTQLPTGERPTASPAVAGDIVFFVTSVENGAQGWSIPTSNLYAFTYLGGAAYAAPGQTTVKNNTSPVARTFNGRANAPFIVDQHVFISSNTGSGLTVESIGDPQDYNNGVGQIGVRILSWRELR